MKQCPKCKREYSDKTLEFCLEDGARLVSFIQTKTSVETVVLPQNAIQPLPISPINSTIESSPETNKPTKVQELRVKAVDQGYKILEIAPIIFALIHNYWQWLFADKHPFYSFIDYFLSGAFIGWLILLVVSVGFSLSAIKFGKNKGFAITSLIILAINFILFIVPRR